MGGWAGRGGPTDDLVGSDPRKTTLNLYNEVSLVASGSEQVVVQYTVPIGYHVLLARIEFSGSNIATYRLYFDAAVQSLTHTWFNGPMSDAWDFKTVLGGLLVPAGTVMKVTAFHNRPAPGDFNARIGGILVLE